MSTSNGNWLVVETQARRERDRSRRQLEAITLNPLTAGCFVLGSTDTHLTRERAMRRRGERSDTVVFDARVWDHDGRYGHLQWYGDVDIADRGHELQRVAEFVGTPLHVVEYSSPPWCWPSTPYYRDKKVFTFRPRGDGKSYPLAQLSRMDLRCRARDVYAPKPSDTPVWWQPVGRGMSPYCFMDFSPRSIEVVTAAELPEIDEVHPRMPEAVLEMRDLMLAALDRDGWRLAGPDLDSVDVIDLYARHAITDVLQELRRLASDA